MWSLFHFVAAMFAFLCRALLTFVNFLSARASEAIGGLAEEEDTRWSAKPWVGWFIVGPAVYCALMFVFMASDLTVAILIFEAMGLTLGGATTSAISFIPLENAMGVVFVALAVFWGIVLFDLWDMTPFGYIWSKMGDVPRRRLVVVVLTCLVITIVNGLIMGIWSQAQLKGGLTEPWQTVLPWIIRGDLVALLITATAVAGKPFGSAITALWVVALLVVRAISSVVLVLLRFIVVLLRAFIHIPLMIVALLAFPGHKLWNWLTEFGWARRLHLAQMETRRVNDLGGDSDSPLIFRGSGAAAADQETATRNKLLLRHVYEDVFPAAAVDLEQYFAAGVLNHDARNGSAAGIEPLRQMLAELQRRAADHRRGSDCGSRQGGQPHSPSWAAITPAWPRSTRCASPRARSSSAGAPCRAGQRRRAGCWAGLSAPGDVESAGNTSAAACPAAAPARRSTRPRKITWSPPSTSRTTVHSAVSEGCRRTSTRQARRGSAASGRGRTCRARGSRSWFESSPRPSSR